MISVVASSRSRSSRIDGLTIVEVLVALLILGIITAAITGIYVSSIRNNADSGMRTQSGQILNSVGRRVANAEAAFAPAAENGVIAIGYGDILTSFPELRQEEGFANADHYRFTVTNLGEVSIQNAVAIRYLIEVCTRRAGAGEENCVQGQTAGPLPAGDDDESGLLEGVV